MYYGTHATDVVGYAYNASIYCTEHIVALLTSNPGDTGHATAAIGNAEAHLDLLARLRGVNRYDESSYDMDEFPKVIFGDQADADDRCETCGEHLVPQD